jgi:hypothetical protein
VTWLPDTEWHQPVDPPCNGDAEADGEEFFPEPDAEPPF